MLEIAVTIFALLLLGGVVVMLIQEPDLLSAGMALVLGMVFFSIPLLIAMAPLFVLFLLTVSALSIGYGVSTISRRRRAQIMERQSYEQARRRKAAPARRETDWYDEIELDPAATRQGRNSAAAESADEFGRGEYGRGDYGRGDYGRGDYGRAPRRDRVAEDPASDNPLTRMARFYRRLGGARSEDTGESEYHSGGGEPMDLEAYEAQRARVRAAARERVLASMEDPIDPQLRGSQQRGAGVQSADGTETRPSGAIAADRVAAQRNGSGEPPRRQERQASLIRLARRL